MKPPRQLVSRVEELEAAEAPREQSVLGWASARELDAAEEIAAARQGGTATPEQLAHAEELLQSCRARMAAGASSFEESPAGEVFRERERQAYWELVREALARRGEPIDHQALHAEARRLAAARTAQE